MDNLVFDNYEVDANAVNSLAKQGIDEFIDECEKNYQQHIEKIVKDIIKSGKERTLIFLAGPSSSGKTTTAHRIEAELMKNGYDAAVVSMDDFYLKREETPIRSDGTYNLESLYALDVPLIEKCMTELLNVGETEIPIFDFKVKKTVGTNKVSLKGKGCVIMEGLNAINPAVCDIDDEGSILKVYVSTATTFMLDNEEIMTPRHNRLIRRMVRDVKFRNTPPAETLEMWPYVVEGEEIYIDPYKDDVDYQINTTMLYEPLLYKEYLNDLLHDNDNSESAITEIKNLLEILNPFKEINQTVKIPENSIMNEFLGSTI